MDGSFIFSIAELAAVIVFIAALAQGKGFGVAVRMSLGVLILGFLAVLALGLLFGLLKLTLGLLMIAVWVAVIYGIVVLVARVVKGATI